MIRQANTKTIYTIPPGMSLGRAVTAILRDLKAHPVDCVIIRGASQVTISGKLEVILAKYRARAQRNPACRRGPLYPKTPARFLRRVIRGMLNYRSVQKKLFRSIIVDPTPEQERTLTSKTEPRMIGVSQICRNDIRRHRSITLRQLLVRL